MHADVVGRRSRDVLADKVGADRELAVPAVDEDRQADGAGTTVVDEFVHGGPDGPAREEDVVDQDDHTSVDGKRDLRLAYDRRVPDSGEVVAVERDVYRAEGNVRALVRTDGRLDAGRQRVTPRANTDDGENGKVTVALDDLVRDPRDGPADIVRPE